MQAGGLERKEGGEMRPLAITLPAEKTIHLTLYAEYFVAILGGEKRIEYRRRTERYDRMFAKPWRRVKFVNGYGRHRPWMVVEIARFEKRADEWRVHLGRVIESGNLDLLHAAPTQERLFAVK